MISKPQASLPSRERGLKLLCPLVVVWYTLVAPFAGAWIEIKNYYKFDDGSTVAPFAGAWIEMPEKDYFARGEVRRSLRGSVD